MSVYGEWKTATISANGTTSNAVDLGREYDYLSIIIPPLDKCKLFLQTAEKLGDTYYPLGKDVTTDEETFGRADTWQIGGKRFIKVVATAKQVVARSIRVSGMRY